MCTKTRIAVRFEGTLSSFFENKTGLKQGDPLLPVWRYKK